MEPVSEFLEKPAMVPVPDDIADLIERKRGELVPHRLLRQGIRYPAGIVYYRLSENFYNPDLVKDEIFLGLQSDPQFNTWTAMKSKHGVEVVSSKNVAVARLVTLREQEYLEVVRGTPILEIRRVQLAQDGLVVMVNKISFIGSLFELPFAAEVSR
jgi:DNA-binding GntR family transcriptional regulator